MMSCLPAGNEHVAVPGLVSVVIPCYNQTRYLREAVGSVFAQAHRPVEVIVVDDGSDEDVKAVTSQWPDVQYTRQANKGVSAARNTGFLRSRGSHVVFLDSDDRLIDDGLAEGVRWLREVPEAAAAVGLCRVIGPSGEPRPFRQQPKVDEDAYFELLRGNFIWMPAQVLYRRDAFTASGGFDTSVDACADYDLYLRLTRVSRLVVHRYVVAEYRNHDANMSSQSMLMLRSALTVLDRQRPFILANPRYRAAYLAGRRFWKEFYGDQVVDEIRTRARQRGTRAGALGTTFMLLRYNPAALVSHVSRKLRRLAGSLFGNQDRNARV